jgi:O-methyltransferase involved in polyketide biosynthesis
MTDSKVDAKTLTGVSETTLWTLYSRAHEASRRNPLIDDPLAVQIMNEIDYDFGKFEPIGRPTSVRKALRPDTQHFAVRALTFDRVIRNFVHKHPHGTVVALAEGLQTTFWRINSPTVRWISLDLPAVISLRERLLPPSPQITHLKTSALDPSWHQHLDPHTPTLITAEGLLMYLQPNQALALINRCAQQNPHGAMVFDVIPPGAKAATGWQLTPHYRTPPMTFGLTSGQARALPKKLPTLESATTIPYIQGRGFRGKMQTVLPRYPVLSHLAASITLLQFRPST